MREPGLISTTAIASLERAINAALRSDPATAARLSRHAGRLLAVHLTLPPLRLSPFLPPAAACQHEADERKEEHA